MIRAAANAAGQLADNLATPAEARAWLASDRASAVYHNPCRLWAGGISQRGAAAMSFLIGSCRRIGVWRPSAARGGWLGHWRLRLAPTGARPRTGEQGAARLAPCSAART